MSVKLSDLSERVMRDKSDQLYSAYLYRHENHADPVRFQREWPGWKRYIYSECESNAYKGRNTCLVNIDPEMYIFKNEIIAALEKEGLSLEQRDAPFYHWSLTWFSEKEKANRVAAAEHRLELMSRSNGY